MILMGLEGFSFKKEIISDTTPTQVHMACLYTVHSTPF